MNMLCMQRWPLLYETVDQAVIVMLTSQIYGGI